MRTIAPTTAALAPAPTRIPAARRTTAAGLPRFDDNEIVEGMDDEFDGGVPTFMSAVLDRRLPPVLLLLLLCGSVV